MKKIVIGSLFVVALLMLLPMVSAVEHSDNRCISRLKDFIKDNDELSKKMKYWLTIIGVFATYAVLMFYWISKIANTE